MVVAARAAGVRKGVKLSAIGTGEEVLGETLGRPVETADVPLEVYRTRLIAAGADAEFADVAVDGSRLVARDGNARLTPDVERVLGRSPRTFRTWAADHLR
ncbi:hypothetical protein AB0C33_40435 [Nonomuraea sp. NPDC048881]|uniref:hypothetical protein n=1 Tax=Nonomuraea sp. NPDC048881 TaxID=3155030 RepID=UPI0033D07FB6